MATGPSSSTVRELPPPHHEGDEDTTWDSTYQREVYRKSPVASRSICRHAVSEGSRAYGIIQKPGNCYDSSSTTSKSWCTWQTSLADSSSSSPTNASSSNNTKKTAVGLVNAITSNRDGSVIVAATDTGIVSLLRGSDGQVLATRKVVTEESTNTDNNNNDAGASIHLSWIPTDETEDDDVLLIEAPNDNDDAGGTNLILVSQIRGTLLNHESPAVVAEAARNMQIQPIVLDATTTIANNDIRAITGCFLTSPPQHQSTKIRLVACDGEGKLLALDYDLQEKNEATLVQSEIALFASQKEADEDDEWLVDFDVGLETIENSGRSFVVAAAFSKLGTRIVWFDPVSLQTACHFELSPHHLLSTASKTSSTTSTRRAKVVDIEPVDSFSKTDTLALAVAVKTPKDDSTTTKTTSTTTSMESMIYVLQVVLDETMGLTILRNPHVVYTIPPPTADESSASSTVVSVSLACIPTVPYSFRYKMWRSRSSSTGNDKDDDNDDDSVVYKEFVTDAESSLAIGKIRSLLARGDFDPADAMIADCGLESLSNDPYAQFHPSEVALHRLKHSLEQGNSSSSNAEAMEQAQLCLRRLASGAVSDQEMGLGLFLQAVDYVMRFPSTSLSMGNFILGLTALSSTIQSVVEALSGKNTGRLASKQASIKNQILALKFLANLKDSEDTAGGGYQLATPFHKIRSASHLFGVLVKEHKFALAETLYRSSLKDQLTAESLVLPILKLRADVNPSEYISLLNTVVLPSLKINNPLFSRLKSWACRVVDELDNVNVEGRNLDTAILLLKTVDKRSRELQLHIHSSFGAFTPFAPRESRQPRRSPRSASSSNPDLSTSGEFNFLFGSSSSKIQQGSTSVLNSHNTIPTILELGEMKRGPAISKLMSQRTDEEDDYAGNEDCVKEKLAEAESLLLARELGLDGTVVSLQDFGRKGGSQCVAKELVRLFSASSVCHEARRQVMSERLKPFCDTFDVCADQAMLACTVDLCRGKNISERAVEESCSIARCCSSVIVKCNVALTVLRAALLCGTVHSDLVLLSKDAITWASCDSSLQTELEEASRLLQIDTVIVKYCGMGARELFRVDNPRHAVRLLDFVTKHIDRESVMIDALSLCGAFHHLSANDAMRRLFQNAIMRGDCDRCVSLLTESIRKDAVLGERSLIGALAFIEEVLAETSIALQSESNFDRISLYQKRSRRITSYAGALILCAMENSLALSPDAGAEIACYVNDLSLGTLRDSFLRIERLQREHSIFISLADFNSAQIILDKAAPFVDEVAAACVATSDPISLNIKLSAAKRACSLLSRGFKGNDVLFVSSVGISKALLAKNHQDEWLFDFLFGIGLLTDGGNILPSRVLISVASALVVESANSRDVSSCIFGMRKIVAAASLLKDWSVMLSRGKELSTVVALSGLLDVVTEVFSRADEGIGETIDAFRQTLQSRAWSIDASTTSSVNKRAESPIRRPPLHSSWYIGDGLLLPPLETLSHCLRFFRGLLDDGRGVEDGSIALVQLVRGRGAHSVALRTLCLSVAVRACSDSSPTHEAISLVCDLEDALSSIAKSLAERSLGGTGSGITSAVVDSQNAVSFLLSLPKKQAFEAYRSCLPTAIKTKDFSRVVTLASVGLLAGSGDAMLGNDGIFVVGWKRQDNFFQQCRKLATMAQWWAILKKYGVEFETQRFQVGKERGSKPSSISEEVSKYAASLLPELIKKLSKVSSTSDVLRLSSLYATAFGLQRSLVLQRHVDFLLAPTEMCSGMGECDFRTSMDLCEKTVRASLLLLHKPLLQCAALRRCLISLDDSEGSGQDYERYALVLALYQDSLTNVIDRQDLTIRNIDPAPYETELELIDRRRDALAILSSYFQGERQALRPMFSKFFLPLRVPFDKTSVETDYKICGVLGSNDEGTFDPLKPLDKFFSSSIDTAAVTALAPLCMPLGLPQGFVHARSLIARFRYSSLNKVAPPSFDNDVSPVVNRIRSPSEKTELAEWCAKQYEDNNSEKLKCLDIVLQSAIQASTDIEHRRRRFLKDKTLEQLEIKALETVKRVTSSKASLSDVVRVKTILLSADSSVKKIVAALITKLDSYIQQSNTEISPEALLDFLYVEGSLLSAHASLENGGAYFTVSHFRRFCSVVHAACHSIAEQHSHIHPGRHAARFCQRWLFYGDEATVTGPNLCVSSVEQGPSTVLPDITEEDTMDFVMDLSGIQSSSDEWATVDGKASTHEKRMVSEEEGSALQAKSSRELSEEASRRSALRIAFVMAFSDGGDTANSGDNSTKENQGSNRMATKRLGLLAKYTQRDSKRDNRVFDHGSELLSIVFARSGVSANLMSRWHSFDSDTSGGSVSFAKKEAPKTITFAMRHRALRAASILCPQEVLEEIVHGEGYLRPHNESEDDCSFHHCAFGAFLAKEIEEMGLNLPHSDLAKISSMGFLSYARALWKHHRDHGADQSKGRLLLLLTEMSLKGDDTDPAFITCLLDEMVRLNLPRSLLLSLERIVSFERRSNSAGLAGNSSVKKALACVAHSILTEVHHALKAGSDDKLDYCSATDTVERLCKIAAAVCNPDEVTVQFAQFIEVLNASPRVSELAQKLAAVCHDSLEQARACSSLQQIKIN